MPPSSHAASHRSTTSSQLSHAASHRSITSSHLSTATSHRSITSSQLSAATTHGSRADTLAAMDRDTPHQSEASRSDAPQTSSYASSSTTRGAEDDDDADSLFDNENHYIIAPPIPTTLATDGPRLRGRALNRTATVGGMGAQFATAGAQFTVPVSAGVGEDEGEGEDLGVVQVQQMLEHAVLTAQTAEAAEAVREMGTVLEARRNREEMYRARLMMFPPVEGMGCVFRR